METRPPQWVGLVSMFPNSPTQGKIKYKELVARLHTGRSRAAEVRPLAEFFGQLDNSDPRVMEVRSWLETEKFSQFHLEQPGQNTICLLSRYLVASGFPVKNFIEEVTFSETEKYKCWHIGLKNMLGPTSLTAKPDDYEYTWFHATTQMGLLGILHFGIVLPTCTDSFEWPGIHVQAFSPQPL